MLIGVNHVNQKRREAERNVHEQLILIRHQKSYTAKENDIDVEYSQTKQTVFKTMRAMTVPTVLPLAVTLSGLTKKRLCQPIDSGYKAERDRENSKG